ncbi:(S)-N-methylcoclaurine 3'-hydroxylase isozyme 1-like [Magnolia sinica]|uniref:(S)-N-methylcoclaurine 3'-hydroxylase isozyme 1-like n=1 Tax=Magnolia sinica TaxID=86752 RepID=UPI0026584153|nr:(S)-N-methylcoclaurine 3'-hydroxylase isozyme 1-like [Magnolia sinica]
MSELARNPKVMRRVCDELQMVVGGEKAMKESHLNHLNYLHASIKESLRLHPPIPLLLPRQALETCDMMNYTIPKDSRVMVNIWAIGRDPGIWKDSLTFSPEWFLETSVDYKGNHFEFTPFAAGRRICPGLPLATLMVQLILASFIHTFDWSLPHGMQPDDLNMDEKFALTLERKHLLLLVPKSVVKIAIKCIYLNNPVVFCMRTCATFSVSYSVRLS